MPKVKVVQLLNYANDSEMCKNCVNFDKDYDEEPCKSCFVTVTEPSEFVRKK